MGSLKPWHIAVLVVLLILLFGAKRLPDASRALGRSLRILKAETRGLQEDDIAAKAAAQSGHEPLAREQTQLDSAPTARPVVEPLEHVRDK